MATAPADYVWGMPGVQLLDADGDGRLDLLRDQSNNLRLLPTSNLVVYGIVALSKRSDKAPSFNLKDPEVRFARPGR